MARLLFIENREKTYFWAAIAKQLQHAGHDIAWLVQNPVFATGLPGKTHTIPFPRRSDLQDRDLADFPELCTDRGREYFESGQAHYGYYRARIAEILDRVAPDCVIGEPTLFHELIAEALCRASSIPFLHPVGERYPPNRFTVFDGATQHPVVDSGAALGWAEALDLAERVRDGRSLPTYMSAAGRYGGLGARANWARTRLRVLYGRARGERYNTPSLSTKLTLGRSVRRNLERWHALAHLPASPERTLLYPLQQQPENTIDVWGRPDFDQVAIVERILRTVPDTVSVAVKGNPKPYYEVSDELLALAERERRVVLLPVAQRMPESMALTAGALTITGTVGYEAVCGRGRCLSIAHPVLDAHFHEFTAPSVEVAAERLLTDPEAGRGSAETGARLMQVLTARSFPGDISDPVSDPASMRDENIAKVTHGVMHAIAGLPL